MTTMKRVYLDTETTGLDPGRAVVVEIAAVVLDDAHQELAHFESLARPRPEQLAGRDAMAALAINRIRPEDLRAAPEAGIVAVAFRSWLELEAPGAPLHAFNVEFDAGFLARPPWLLKRDRFLRCVMLDAMKVMGPRGGLERRYDGSWKWPRLSEAARFFRVAVEGEPHRALTDARTAARIHAALYPEIRWENP